MNCWQLPEEFQKTRGEIPDYSAQRAAPCAAEQTYRSGVIPVCWLYILVVFSLKASTESDRTMVMVQPPKPPPVMREPYTPSQDEAIWTSRSSSVQLTS